MLAVRDLSAWYGTVPVITGMSFSLARREVLAVLGRNGVGKTTLLRTLMGLVPRCEGEIRLDGQDVARNATHVIARRGMSLVPQGRGILSRLTVAENLAAGARAGGPGSAQAVEEAIAAFPALRERMKAPGGALSGGQQQQLAIARALAGRPKVMLLDEPSEGVQPNIVHEIGALIGRLGETADMAVLLVEQNVELALRVAHRCLVVEKGRIVHEGPVEEFRDDAVLKRYLAL